MNLSIKELTKLKNLQIKEILTKYKNIFKDIKNSEDTYNINEAFNLIIESRDVEDKDKIILKDCRIFFIDEDIKRLRKEWAPIREKYSRMETTIEEDDKYYIFQDKINDKKREIDNIEENYKYRDYGNVLSDALEQTGSLLKELKR